MPAKSESRVGGTIDNRQSHKEYYLESGDRLSFFFEEGAETPDGQRLLDPERALFKIAHALHLYNDHFWNATVNERVKRVCRSLEFVKPAVAQSMLIFKHPKIGGLVTPHQDASYLYTEPVNVLGFWYALDDVTEQNGCLWFLKGSHKDGVHRRYVRNPDRTSDELAVFDAPNRRYDLDEFAPCPAKRGSCVLIHGQVVHYSKPNVSEKSRHAYSFHIIEQYRTKWSEQNWLQSRNGFCSVYNN